MTQGHPLQRPETPNLRWFEENPTCRQCGKPGAGILRGVQNESYGQHCKRCAERRLKASAEARAALAKASPSSLSRPA